jgi:hypothetical protein
LGTVLPVLPLESAETLEDVMNKVAWIAMGIIAPAVVSLILGTDVAHAGPPLLCHAIEIGEAQSLPWGTGTWQSDQIKLTEEDFVSRTLALLSPDAATLTRMETIRRATIHAAEHPGAAELLLKAIQSRVHDARSPSAAALFDLGYLCAAYDQMNVVIDHNATGFSGGKRSELSVPAGIRAYDLVRKSASMSPDDHAIEFALALMTLAPSHASHKSHLRRAADGATEGSLLAQNLLTRFGQAGQSLSEMKSSFGAVSDGERR